MATPEPFVPAGSSPPSIIYVLVNRGPKVVLAEHTALAGNFQQATLQILQKLERSVEWKSYIYGEYAFHYIIDGELWFVCMAERAMGRRIPFAFLTQVQDAFQGRYTTEQVMSANPFGMQQGFKKTLQEQMEKHNSPDADRVTAMMAKVQNINDNLMESIDKILERQEKIELLVTRSEMLSVSSSSFRREAVRLRRAVWWRNARTQAFLGLMGILILLIIVFSSCGLTLNEC